MEKSSRIFIFQSLALTIIMRDVMLLLMYSLEEVHVSVVHLELSKLQDRILSHS